MKSQIFFWGAPPPDHFILLQFPVLIFKRKKSKKKINKFFTNYIPSSFSTSSLTFEMIHHIQYFLFLEMSFFEVWRGSITIIFKIISSLSLVHFLFKIMKKIGGVGVCLPGAVTKSKILFTDPVSILLS